MLTQTDNTPAAAPTVSPERRFNRWSLVGSLAALAVALLFPLVFHNNVWLNIGILILLYAMAAQGWNILGGLAGQISLGHALFFGLGAYSTALVSEKLADTATRQATVSPWFGLIAGALIAAIVATIIGWPTFRLRGHYFSIATIAIGSIATGLFQSWAWVNGNTGVYQPILEPSLWNFQFGEDKLPFYYIILTMLTLTMVFVWWLMRSRFGYYFQAIKNDQDAARSLGISATRYKVTAYVFSAIVTAFAGGFYGQYITYIGPDNVLALELSVIITVIAILGGAGTLWGPVLGALLLVPLQEFTRTFFSQLGGGGKALDLVIYGLLVTLIAVFQPAGLIAIFRSLWRTVSRRLKRSPLR
jgi:branched-chain amino acid transport system permease protein